MTSQRMQFLIILSIRNVPKRPSTISSSTGSSRWSAVGPGPVNPTGFTKDHFSDLQNLAATKNGYLYVYVSNESPVNVFFDNLQLVHTRSALLEETHYYPFGLTMAGISNKAVAIGRPENKRKYQGYELNSDFDINLYESFYRLHDPQLGRFLQIDLKPNVSSSPYTSMLNNPLIYSDLLGDTVRVSGSEEAVKQFKEISDGALGGFYTTEVDQKGNVKFISSGKEGEMSSAQKAFHDILSGIFEQTEVTKIGLVQDDSRIMGGSFELGEIDVSDIAAFGSNKAMSAASTLTHEIVEQNFKQKDGLAYSEAHEKSIEAEHKITGYKRNEKGQTSKASIDEKGRISGTITVPYIKDKDIIWVTISVENTNIKKVEEQ